MSADIINAFLNGYGDVDVTSLVQDLGLTSDHSSVHPPTSPG
jgi:hypothetical protein